jgi:hypothetical protein
MTSRQITNPDQIKTQFPWLIDSDQADPATLGKKSPHG